MTAVTISLRKTMTAVILFLFNCFIQLALLKLPLISCEDLLTPRVGHVAARALRERLNVGVALRTARDRSAVHQRRNPRILPAKHVCERKDRDPESHGERDGCAA